MTTPRQRMLAAFEYGKPDRIPVVYHPSPAGLYVHGQKLLDLFNAYPPDNPITFATLPAPPPGAIGPDGRYHEIVKSPWGSEWECLIYGIHGHPKTYPISGWEAGRDYQFPPIPPVRAADKAYYATQRENYMVFTGWVSILDQLYALRPMDEALMDFYTEDRLLLAFHERLMDYWEQTIQSYLDLGADVIVFGDDWGTQSSTMVPPDFFRKFFKPRYARLMRPIKQAGRKVFFHSCGFLGEIFDELLDLGIDGLWPQITQFERDPATAEKCRAHKVAIYIHPDRQRLMPLGAPQDITAAIRHYAERYRRMGGGGIFYVEIENDAPFENVAALIKAIHKFR